MDTDDEVDFAPITERSPTVIEEREIESLNRIASSKLGQALSASASKKETKDPTLDPTSPQFDHYRWAQTVLGQAQEADIDIIHQGVVFSNLTISGSGAALQYQNTLLSSIGVPFRAAARALSGKNRSPPRRILHEFDGLLQGGELLLVLGRPGSGCTTFLKTITGHLGGLSMDPNSTIHYEGVEYKQMIKHHRGAVAYNKEVRCSSYLTMSSISAANGSYLFLG